jgi:hypothetical protein
MKNKVLTFSVIAVFGWLIIDRPHPSTAPLVQSSASRTLAADVPRQHLWRRFAVVI